MGLNIFSDTEQKKNADYISSKLLGMLKKNVKKEEKEAKEELYDMDEYNRYERKKVFLDNKSRNGNELVWVTDDNSVCVSKNGDGGAFSKEEVNLPSDVKIGGVYEKIGGEFVYNLKLTEALKNVE